MLIMDMDSGRRVLPTPLFERRLTAFVTNVLGFVLPEVPNPAQVRAIARNKARDEAIERQLAGLRTAVNFFPLSDIHIGSPKVTAKPVVIERINDPTLTGFYPGTVAPARPGVYELYGHDGGGAFAYWDGGRWFLTKSTPANALVVARAQCVDVMRCRVGDRTHDFYKWRGFTTEQK